MRLTFLHLSDFRNYHSLDFKPSGALNLLVGANGQGKSNIVEAIYLLATTRSLRAHKDQELLKRNAEVGRALARIGRDAREDVAVEMVITPTHKFGKVNGVRQTRLWDMLGEFNAVQFAPTDLELVTGPPEGRRRFLNLQIAQASGGYTYSLISYKRVLDQRNRLLRDSARAGGMGNAARQTLDVLTEQLLTYGGEILQHRLRFITSLARYADTLHQELAGSELRLEVIYHPGWPPPGSRAGPAAGAQEPSAPTLEAFRASLEKLRPDEVRRGMTLVGPHRDDLQFVVEGMDIRIYGSRGEQRTVALSLKLAEFLLLQELTGEPPVMLLDDVLSELDDDRSIQVIRKIAGLCQTFMTGASLRAFPPDIISQGELFHIRAGAIVEAPGG